MRGAASMNSARADTSRTGGSWPKAMATSGRVPDSTSDSAHPNGRRPSRDVPDHARSPELERREERQHDRVERLRPLEARQVTGARERLPSCVREPRRDAVGEDVEVAVVVLADEDERRNVDRSEPGLEILREEHLLVLRADL